MRALSRIDPSKEEGEQNLAAPTRTGTVSRRSSRKRLDEEASYDLITTFDAVHDQADPAAVLKGIADALRDDGVYLMQEIAGSSHVHKNMAHPLAPFLYAVSTTHCMTVSLAQGGEGLGTMWGEEKAKEMLRDAGFGRVEVKQLPHDFVNSYYIVTKG